MSNCIVLIMILLGLHSPLMAEELRVAASAYLSAPYTIYVNDELRGGLVKDIFDQLGTELGIRVHYLDCPRKRVEQSLLNGEIHIAPVAHPQWLSPTYAGDWTDPIFALRELLVFRANSKFHYRGPDDLKGLRIGAILGYHYPIVDPYFKSGAAIRSDVQKADQNVDMLLNERIDAYLIHDLTHRYFQKTDARSKLLRAEDVGSHARDISWAVSKKTPVPVARLKDFIRDLKKSGKLEAMMKKYGLVGDIFAPPPTGN